ncbi:Krueppel-like factor 6 [Trachymyrmex septentrionalis]|uniref:Krueppel-like factor 6 n=1 Tax=Trachymyrmex septentrionalis TaxID=34720 RepID=A0A151JU40_9HYME|nr:Krueppel-like factor 6 [Trachymyrmex septentrionalis]
MDTLLPSGNIFRELQDIHDTGYFSAQPSLEDHWQQRRIRVLHNNKVPRVDKRDTAYAIAAYVATAPATTRTDGVAGIETRSWKTDIDRLPTYAASLSRIYYANARERLRIP